MPYEDDISLVFRRRVEKVEEVQPIELLTTQPPTATAPTEGLPTSPTVGRFYEFASRPGTLYHIGPDNVWRAVVSVAVV